MTVKLKQNNGNGSIIPNSIISFSYSEDATALDPSNITGGTSDVSVTAESNDEPIGNSISENSKLLINNDVVINSDTMGDISFSVKNVNVANGIVSFSGPTVQRNLNAIKSADPFSGTLSDAIDYYCSLVNVVAYYDGNLLSHLNNVNVNFLGWTANVWEKMKELIAFQKAYDPSRISSINDGYYSFEVYVSTATNSLTFREALSDENIIDLSNAKVDQSINIDSNSTAKSVSVTGYITSKLEDTEPFLTTINNGRYISPIYDLSFYDENADPSVAFKSSIDTSGLTLSAGEKIERIYDMNIHLDSVATPRCVSTISRLPYRKARGNMVHYDYSPDFEMQWDWTVWDYVLTPQMHGTLRVYCNPVGYENAPGVGEYVFYDESSLNLGGYYFLGGHVCTQSQQSEYGETWFEMHGTTPGNFNYLSGSLYGAEYETSYSIGEYVVVGDGDIPILPSEWEGLGGSVTVEKAEVEGQIKVTIKAPDANTLISADDPNTTVNGPFRIGVEIADGVEYPAFWILGTGIQFEPKTVKYITGIEEDYTSVDEATAVDSIFITDETKLNSVAMHAAQSAASPKITLTQSIDAATLNGSVIGKVIAEDGINYRIETASYSETGASVTGKPYTSFMDFNAGMIGVDATFAYFDTYANSLKFNEFAITPRIGA